MEKMKRVVVGATESTIALSCLRTGTPIIAKKDGEIRGMIMKDGINGWILRYPCGGGCDGHHESEAKCIESASEYGYTFYAEDQ